MPKYEIPNLANACRVLKSLAGEADGLTLRELAARLELPHTSALRIVNTLCDAGFLHRAGNLYTLGAGLIPLGQQALARLDIRAVARPALRELSGQTGETSHLAIPSGRYSLLVEVIQSPSPIRIGAPPGTLADLYCSAHGKIFLANMPEDKIEPLVGPFPLHARTKNTLDTLAKLRAEFRKIRARGYSVDDEEYFEGARCLAAPVYDATGTVVAAAGITGSTSRFTAARIPAVAQQVMAAAAAISRGLGHSPQVAGGAQR